jgi:hypothetical protein
MERPPKLMVSHKHPMAFFGLVQAPVYFGSMATHSLRFNHTVMNHRF